MQNISEKDYYKLLNIAQEISDFGPLLINHLQVTQNKRTYSLIFEAFRSLGAFSRLIQSEYLVQSSSVLRLFTEEVSKVIILEKYPELYAKFSKHCEVRESIIELTQKERKKKVIESFSLNDNQYQNALSYLDYGWIKSVNKDGKYGYHEMLKMAFADDAILVWIDRLDQFIHQNISTLSLAKEDYQNTKLDWIYLACFVFEKLFVSFHNLCGKEFTIKGKRLFEDEFWPLFERIIEYHSTLR